MRKPCLSWAESLWLWGCVWLVLASHATGQGIRAPHGGIPGYEYKLWSDREGAPGTITAIAQTDDGFLWLGSTGGLYRFDGITFTRVEPAGTTVPAGKVTALAADRLGGLWIGYNRHGIAYVHNGTATMFGAPAGGTGNVSRIVVAPDGTPWAVVGNELMREDHGAWTNVTREYQLQGPVEFLLFRRDGTMLLSDEKNLLYFGPGSSKPEIVLRTAGWLEGMTLRTDGRVVLADSSGEIRAAIKESSPRTPTMFGKNPHGLRSDLEGGLWTSDDSRGICRLLPAFGQDGAILRLDLNGCIDEGGDSAPASASIVDRNGKIWLAGAKGLYRFQKARIQLAPVAVQDGAAMSVGPTGTLWLGTSDQPLVSYGPAAWQAHGVVRRVRPVYAAPDGSVWFGGPGLDKAADVEGLYHLVDGHMRAIPLPKGLENFPVQSIAEDANGDLLISIVRNGVYRIRGGVWTSMEHLLGAKATPFLIAAAPDRTVWLGFSDSRVAHWDGQTFKWRTLPPSSIGGVLSFAFHGEDVWVAGENGLAVLPADGTPVMLRTPTLAGVSGLAFSPDGDLWMNALAGVLHVTAQALQNSLQNPTVPLAWEMVGERDGLHGQPSQLRPLQSAAFASGRLWFSTTRMVGSIAPGQRVRDDQVPTALQTRLSVDGRELPVNATYTLPANTRLVEARSSAVELSRPEGVKFFYTLNGDPVSRSGDALQPTITFVGLSRGAYDLGVVVCNADGACSPSTKTLHFIIAPHFYQRRTLQVVAAALLLAILLLLYRWRVRLVCDRVEAEARGQLSERERIARELHDTLLQSMQGLSLKFEAALHVMGDDDASKPQLARALDDADAVMAVGRERLRDLRFQDRDDNELLQKLRTLVGSEERSSALPIQLHVHGTQEPLKTRVNQESFEIGSEALRNAVRHSRGHRVDIHLRFGLLRFEMEVVDDGAGFDPSRADLTSGGHFGITGMQERASVLQGRLTITTVPGGGTRVRVRVPGSVAYRFGIAGRLLLRTPSWLNPSRFHSTGFFHR